MIEIKFRFWTPDRRMIDDHDGFTEGIGINQAIEVSKSLGYVAMMFIGMVDKHNTEMYDGDIVFDGEHYWFITWLDQSAGFYMARSRGGIHYRMEFAQCGQSQSDGPVKCDTIEVVGNIYQHPNAIKS